MKTHPRFNPSRFFFTVACVLIIIGWLFMVSGCQLFRPFLP